MIYRKFQYNIILKLINVTFQFKEFGEKFSQLNPDLKINIYFVTYPKLW